MKKLFLIGSIFLGIARRNWEVSCSNILCRVVLVACFAASADTPGSAKVPHEWSYGFRMS